MISDQSAAYPVFGTQQHYDGAVVAVRTDEVVLPDGTPVRRDVVEHPGSVSVIAVDDQERVLLLQQYRHPASRLLWEPPAGLLDEPGEPPLETAARELLEEAGLRAERWTVLVDAFTSPGMSDEATRVYLAQGVCEVPDEERPPREHEELDMPVRWISIDEGVDGILAGRLHNPLAIMGILAVAQVRARGWSDVRPAETPWPERPAGGVKG